MHAVEEAAIGGIFDKARFHKINFIKHKQYYYYRGDTWTNIKEMMGSTNILRWFVPFAYYNKHDYTDVFEGKVKNAKEIDALFAYIKFDK